MMNAQPSTHQSSVTTSGPESGCPIHLLIIQDDDSGYSAIALNLPGSGSCGDTEEEAIENAKEAVRGVLEEYRESGEAIPWKDTRDVEIPPSAKQLWVIVNV